jgi:hypothetical protein
MICQIISWQVVVLLMQVSSNQASFPPQKLFQVSKRALTLFRYQLFTQFHSLLPTLFPRVMIMTTESWSWCPTLWREMIKTSHAKISMEKWEFQLLYKLQLMKITKDVQVECAMVSPIQVITVFQRVQRSSSLLVEQTTRSQLEWQRSSLYKPRFKQRRPENTTT